MRNKKNDREITMHVARIDDPIFLGKKAQKMAAELLAKEHRGPGDTNVAAAYRLQTRLGVAASIILQCWNREPREMKVSRWMALFHAHWREFGEIAGNAYEAKREGTHAHPAFVRLADFVAGRASDEERETR